jgi:shikimate kinase
VGCSAPSESMGHSPSQAMPTVCEGARARQLALSIMFNPVIHILGPGGAGKSIAGALLAEKLGWLCIDLDRYFLDNTGHISTFIENRGYAEYAKHNVCNYVDVLSKTIEPAVVILSSGFMNYAADVDPRYQQIRGEIEEHPLSVLLLPSFDLEECVEVIVNRQLHRAYLSANKQREEERIRARFPLFMALRCKRFLTKESPVQIATELETFVMAGHLFKRRRAGRRCALAISSGKRMGKHERHS